MDKDKWSLDKCQEIASTMLSRRDWAKKHNVSYQKADKKGWLTLCPTKAELREKLEKQNANNGVTTMNKKKSPNRVVFSVGKMNSKNYPKGSILITVYKQDKYFKQHVFDGRVMPIEEAIKKAREKAEEYRVEHGVDIIEKSNKAMLETLHSEVRSISTGGAKTKKKYDYPSDATVESAGVLMDALENGNRRKAVVRYAYKQFGFDRVRDVLQTALEHLNDVSAEDREHKQKESEAVMAVARTMLKTYEDTGIDLRENIDDPKILTAYKRLLMEKREQAKALESKRDTGIYELNGIRWNSATEQNPPTEFKLWLNQNNKDDFEELRVAI